MTAALILAAPVVVLAQTCDSLTNDPVACVQNGGTWNQGAAICQCLTGTSPTGSGSANSGGAPSQFCDTANGYTMLNGVCVPKSPASSGLASKTKLSDLIKEVLTILLTLAGIAAVIFIIIGGFQYMTSGGNDEQAEKGRKALTNAVIGLVAVILAYAIVTIVTNFVTGTTGFGF